MEDPFDWTVDQVVDALCQQRSSWTKSTAAPALPEARYLEKALRENKINGYILLTQVDNASLREDLGIKILGDRGTIVLAIQKLRSQSPKYSDYVQEVASQTALPGAGLSMGSAAVSQSGFGSPYYGSPMFSGPAAPSIQYGHFYGNRQSPVLSHQHVRSPERGVGMSGNSIVGQTKLGYDSWSEVFSRTPQLRRPDAPQVQLPRDAESDVPRTPLSDIASEKQPHVAESPVAQGLHRIDDGIGGSLVRSGSQESQLVRKSNNRSGETIVTDQSGRKRRKLKLLPAESKDNVQHGQESDGSAEDHVSAATAPEKDKSVTGNHGLKRFESEIVTLSADEVVPESSTVPEASSRSLRHVMGREKAFRLTYLGSKALLVDDIFYGKSGVGDEVKIDVQHSVPEDSEQASRPETYYISSGTDISSGRRLYVHKLMKYFLNRSERKDFTHNSHKYTAVIPYSESVRKKHSHQSFTLFSQSSSAVKATREDLTRWTERIASDSSLTQSNPLEDEQSSLPSGSDENHDWDYLQKWRYVDQGDEELPVYGESGSEGSYDSDTWKEIEDEQVTREQALSRRKQLTSEEVSMAIDQAIEGLEAEWQTKVLPSKASKAWRLWTKSRRDEMKHHQIQQATARIEYLSDNRLSKLRREITSEVWSNTASVKVQCRVLEATIFEREDERWRVSVLQSKSQPAKPTKIAKQQVKAPSPHDSLGDDEEIIESEDTVESSDDGLEKFIIADNDIDESFGDTEGHMSDIRIQDADDEHEMDVDNDNDTEIEDKAVTPPAQRWPSHTPKGTGILTLLGDTTDCVDVSPVAESDSEMSRPKHEPLDRLPPSSVLSSARSLPDPFTRKVVSDATTTSPIKQEDFIDLTLPSDPPEPDTSRYSSDPYLSIHTPPLNPIDNNPFRDKEKKQPLPEFRLPPMPSSVINLEDESSSKSTDGSHHSRHEELPELWDVQAIAQLSPPYLVERQDRKRLLILYIHRLSSSDRQGIISRTITVDSKQSQSDVWNGLMAIKSHAHKIRGADTRTSNDIMRMAQFYVCWSQNTMCSTNGFPKKMVERTLQDESGFDCFYKFLCECLGRYEHEIVSEPVFIGGTPEAANLKHGKRKLGSLTGS